MAVTFANVQALASEFASSSQTRIDPFLDQARRRINADYWGDLYDDGVLYLAAHLLALAEPPSNKVGGGMTSQTAGPLSMSWAALPWSAEWFNASAWGRTYQGLVQNLRYRATPRAI